MAKIQYVSRLSPKNIRSNKNFWDGFKPFYRIELQISMISSLLNTKGN